MKKDAALKVLELLTLMVDAIDEIRRIVLQEVED